MRNGFNWVKGSIQGVEYSSGILLIPLSVPCTSIAAFQQIFVCSKMYRSPGSKKNPTASGIRFNGSPDIVTPPFGLTL